MTDELAVAGHALHYNEIISYRVLAMIMTLLLLPSQPVQILSP